MDTKEKLRNFLSVSLIVALTLNTLITYTRAQPYRDIAIINITAPKTVMQGHIVRIAVTLENQGELTENFTLYASFCVSLDHTLAPKTSTTITYSVDTSSIPLGNYTLWAYVLPCFGDQDTNDNIYVDGVLKVVTPQAGGLACVRKGVYPCYN